MCLHPLDPFLSFWKLAQVCFGTTSSFFFFLSFYWHADEEEELDGEEEWRDLDWRRWPESTTPSEREKTKGSLKKENPYIPFLPTFINVQNMLEKLLI